RSHGFQRRRVSYKRSFAARSDERRGPIVVITRPFAAPHDRAFSGKLLRWKFEFASPLREPLSCPFTLFPTLYKHSSWLNS
ncbi:MAG TPA: hypothetical protein VEA63_07750, partial [Opitutus sp.]|nr:hypothetical protein [Opitutus sp.]